ncbi:MULTISPECIES: FAD-dependent oxidoreductase [unclassified Streptomyces]|uniref:NAD(P)/FAD-dependent oxidoreductase n=1 Tax=unclassified Streptomyces TaxID=2593676 RepID=UPI00081EE97B|nr:MULTISPECIES: FAD-dependent oxidoreductase [unclassified Streptomyces]MYR30328.1 NAD(P)-binding protein [Streptomyces sp. SID4945]SCF49426.1 Predicted NAD/FAD-binding protein [Streptomyces sp. LcepLS]
MRTHDHGDPAQPGAAPHTAVIGAGVAGLTAAHVLTGSRPVDLYEADERLGGHAHTHEVLDSRGLPVHVDSGFIVHNRRTYPTLLRLFEELGVETRESEMSMSVRCEGCGLEYAGARGPGGLLASPRHALSAPYRRLLREVPRFHRAARATLATPEPDEAAPETLSRFLTAHRFSRYFVTHFMTPLVAAVWSCDAHTALRYPARYLFRFLDHHGLLSVTGSPAWRTVSGGSRTYVELLAKRLHRVRTGTPVRAVRRHADGVDVTDGGGTTRTYESVVIATHPDQALALLADPSDAESAALGAFRYSRNPTLLHTDTSVLPRAPRARASWNYLLPDCAAPADHVRISYDMNRLQGLRTPDRYVVTLGGEDRVDPGSVLARMVYEHPVYTPESVTAQRLLPALNQGRTAFAGAYFGWGFHEDGALAGARAAESLGGRW